MNAIINLTRGKVNGLISWLERCDGQFCENVSMVALGATSLFIIVHSLASIG